MFTWWVDSMTYNEQFDEGTEKEAKNFLFGPLSKACRFRFYLYAKASKLCRAGSIGWLNDRDIVRPYSILGVSSRASDVMIIPYSLSVMLYCDDNSFFVIILSVLKTLSSTSASSPSNLLVRTFPLMMY